DRLDLRRLRGRGAARPAASASWCSGRPGTAVSPGLVAEEIAELILGELRRPQREIDADDRRVLGALARVEDEEGAVRTPRQNVGVGVRNRAHRTGLAAGHRHEIRVAERPRAEAEIADPLPIGGP